MTSMLIVGNCRGIRSERRLCVEYRRGPLSILTEPRIGPEWPLILPISIPPMAEREGSVVKLGNVAMVLDPHQQGLSVSAIARQTGFNRKTVRRYIERGLEPPAYGPRAPRPTLLDPFAAYLRRRVEAFPA